ncbi:MAG: TonB-dependent receptor [Flavobacteriaceae bacterium]|nr:MAG: TonB-dependent receptor [Flavobacteriaceae bacterium]
MKFYQLLFFIMSISLFAQSGKISGTITFKDGTPVELASIFITNISKHTYTNEIGFFELNQIAYGKHVVRIKFFGRNTEKVTVNLTTNGAILNYSLNYNQSNELLEVVIKGKTKEAKIESRGFTVNAIKMKDIELQSIQVNEVLDRSAGVRIRQKGGLGSHTHYNINGLSGNAIQVFINGSPIRSFGPSFSLSSIPTNMIERIEVYKGVVPVELAGDALGGAINVILKENFKRNSLSASYSFGSFNTHQVSLFGNNYDEKSGFTIRGSSFYNYSDNNYKVWGNQVYTTDPTTGDITYIKATRFHDSYMSGGFKVDAGVSKRKWADELFLGVLYSKLNRDIQHGATMESVYGNRMSDQSTKLISLSYKDKNFLSNDKLSMELFSSYSQLKRQITDIFPDIYDWDGKRKKRFDSEGNFIGYYEYFSGAEAGNPTLEENIEKVYIGRVTSHYEISKNHYFTGNFLHSRFTRNSEDPLRHIDIRNLEDTRFSNKNILGLGYTFQAFDKKLKMSVFYKYFNQNIRIIEYKKDNDVAAVTLNDVNRTVDANGYGFTVAYELVPNILLQISAENSFRLPVASELFGNIAENLEPNYNLESEKSKNLNLGLSLGTFVFGESELRIKMNTFIRDTKDKIKLNVREDNTDPTTEFINDESYLSKGFDLDVFYSYNRKLDFNANISVFNSRFNTQFDETGLAFNWYKDRERNAPFFTANANLGYNFSNLFKKESQTKFTANLAYVHWFYRDWESLGGSGKDIIPTQLVSDISITHTFPKKRTTISLDARNIFNTQVFDNYALQKPGRAFYIKINHRIL